MFCKECGKELPEGVSFCKYCGAKIDNLQIDSQDSNIEKSVVKDTAKKNNKKQTNKQDSPKGNGKKAAIIAISCSVGGIILIAGIILFMFRNEISFMRNLFGAEEKIEDMIEDEKEDLDIFDEDEDEEDDEYLEPDEDASSETDSSKSEKSEYILDNSDKEVISESQLSGLSKDELRLARNELYARHGRKFKDAAIQDYFNKCSWYNGTIEADSFNEDMLNDVEKKNREIIVNYEKEKGYR